MDGRHIDGHTHTQNRKGEDGIRTHDHEYVLRCSASELPRTELMCVYLYIYTGIM